ncbi:MAG: hypothetical protein ACKO1T_00405 [Sediminibacterium sp.]
MLTKFPELPFGALGITKFTYLNIPVSWVVLLMLYVPNNAALGLIA